jgi:hypothetical protein
MFSSRIEADEEALDNLLDEALTSIDNIQRGLSDLRVQKIVVYVKSISSGLRSHNNHNHGNSSVLQSNLFGHFILHLQDHSGSIQGFLSSADYAKIQQHHNNNNNNNLTVRSSLSSSWSSLEHCLLYLENVSIFVTHSPFERYLSLHWKTVIRVIALTPGS